MEKLSETVAADDGNDLGDLAVTGAAKWRTTALSDIMKGTLALVIVDKGGSGA